jgi:hypothetical protein
MYFLLIEKLILNYILNIINIHTLYQQNNFLSSELYENN